MESLPPVPTILQNHVEMVEALAVEEPKMVKPIVETSEMSVDGIANAESSDVEEQQTTTDITMDEIEPTDEDEIEPTDEESVKKSKKYDPDMVFTLTNLKTGDVLKVVGGVPCVVEKLLSLGLKASSSACNNAIKGVTNSHCGYTITCNKSLKRVKKSKKNASKKGKKKTSQKKKATKKSKKTSQKKKATKKSKKTSKKKKAKKVVKKVNKKKAAKKAKKTSRKVVKKGRKAVKKTKKAKRSTKKSTKKTTKRSTKKSTKKTTKRTVKK